MHAVVKRECMHAVVKRECMHAVSRGEEGVHACSEVEVRREQGDNTGRDETAQT